MDRLAVIAAAGNTGSEPGKFVKAFDQAVADKQRIVFVGHSLGQAPATTGSALYREVFLHAQHLKLKRAGKSLTAVQDKMSLNSCVCCSGVQ